MLLSQSYLSIFVTLLNVYNFQIYSIHISCLISSELISSGKALWFAAKCCSREVLESCCKIFIAITSQQQSGFLFPSQPCCFRGREVSQPSWSLCWGFQQGALVFSLTLGKTPPYAGHNLQVNTCSVDFINLVDTFLN